LEVFAGVQGEFAEGFAGDGVDETDFEVLDEQDDAGSRVGAADSDVMQFAFVTDGDVACN